jgi:hypothetical protein
LAESHDAPHVSPEEATRDLVGRVAVGGAAYWLALFALAIVAAAGLIALLGLVASGPEPRTKWGYSAGTLAFLLSTAHTGPILVLMTRVAKGFWGIPLRRAAELLTVAGLVTTPLFIILLQQLPDWRNRPSIWFDWPGAPQLWDSAAIIILSLLGLTLLFLGSLPDIAALRDRRQNSRREAAGRLEGRPLRGWLALGWSGTVRQWQVLSGGLVLLGAFYFMLFAFIHVFVISDLGMSLVPGWKSAIMPTYHGVSSLQAGVATTIVTLAALRHFGRLQRYIGLDPFWGCAKLLLALSLLWFYFTWSELLATWYGRLPEEQFILELTMFGPYLGLFVLSASLNFILPFLLLIFNPIRVSIKGPACVAVLVLVGNLIDRLRIYVASWSVAGPVGQHFEHAPPAVFPTLSDILIILGAPAAVALFYLLALRLVPPISLWEYKTGLLLSLERPYLKTAVAVIAKPR